MLLRVSGRDMLFSQLAGTFVGVIWSVLVYYTVLHWDAVGHITLGQGEWANLGAEGSHVLAQVFGKFGFARIFRHHRPFMWWSVVMLVLGLVCPVLRRYVPRRRRHWVPDTVLIGVGQFAPANAYSVVSALALAYLYRVHLERKHPVWFGRYQMISTSALNMGVGIGGLLLFVLQAALGDHQHALVPDLGGPTGDGCLVNASMPQF